MAFSWPYMSFNPFEGDCCDVAGCDQCKTKRLSSWLARNPKGASAFEEPWPGFISNCARWIDNLPDKPSNIVLTSASDIFHPNVQYTCLDEMFYCVARVAPQHNYLILTKRPDMMAEYFPQVECEFWQVWETKDGDQDHMSWPLPNVWLGISVSNQQEVDDMLPLLLDIPAAHRFVHMEPMSGEINMWRFFPKGSCPMPKKEIFKQMLGLEHDVENPDYQNGIDAIFYGSGAGEAASMNPEWLASLHEQCAAAKVPFLPTSRNAWTAGNAAAH